MMRRWEREPRGRRQVLLAGGGSVKAQSMSLSDSMATEVRGSLNHRGFQEGGSHPLAGPHHPHRPTPHLTPNSRYSPGWKVPPLQGGATVLVQGF